MNAANRDTRDAAGWRRLGKRTSIVPYRWETHDNVIKVLVQQSLSTILQNGTLGPWKLDQDRASECPYVIAVRNTDDGISNTRDRHRTAFLIARISEIRESGARHLIALGDYSTLALGWRGSRNPVTYTTLSALHIDLSTLTWSPIPGSYIPQ